MRSLNLRRMIRTVAALAIPAVLALGAGCAHKAQPASEAVIATPDMSPIWVARVAAQQVPMQTITSGEESRVSLLLSVLPMAKTARFVSLEGIEGASISVENNTDAVIKTTPTARAENGLAFFDVDSVDGKTTRVAVAVQIAARPKVTFRFRSKGQVVNSVSVAGDFNGWSASANPMKELMPGMWEVVVPVDPGTYKYKVVVDGQWITDPENPNSEPDGYRNSLLEVKGEGRKPSASAVVVSPSMPGSSGVPGFYLPGNEAAQIDRSRVRVLVNNRLLPQDMAEVGEDNYIRLTATSEYWGVENSVMLLAADASGRLVHQVAEFDYPNAPRSPKDEIIYFTFTDRFHDGDPSLNRPIDDAEIAKGANYEGGDFDGIRKKIESGYFEELGMTTLWLSPVYKQPAHAERDYLPPRFKYTGYHGYWPISLTETNEQFGTMEDLRSLVTTAKGRRMGILLDLVSNHMHQENPLVKQNPNWVTPLVLPNGKNNIREFDAYPITTWFDSFLPDLNYDENPEIKDVMVENAIYWLKQTGADGFRHDAVKHISTGYWVSLTERLRAEVELPEGRRLYQVGETISGRGVINEYVSPTMMDGQFDFPLVWSIRDVLGREGGNMKALAATVEGSIAEYPAGSIMSPLIDNHDVTRFMAFADGDIPDGTDEKVVGRETPPVVDNPESYDKLRLALALLFTIPGPPTVYYGTEVGMTGAGDPDNRRFMQWSGYTPDQLRLKDSFAALANARNASHALRRGAFVPLASDDERYVYARVSPTETVLVALLRKPADAGAVIGLPTPWGKPASLEPIVNGGATAELTASGVNLGGGNRTFGVWRVVW